MKRFFIDLCTLAIIGCGVIPLFNASLWPLNVTIAAVMAIAAILVRRSWLKKIEADNQNTTDDDHAE